MFIFPPSLGLSYSSPLISEQLLDDFLILPLFFMAAWDGIDVLLNDIIRMIFSSSLPNELPSFSPNDIIMLSSLPNGIERGWANSKVLNMQIVRGWTIKLKIMRDSKSYFYKNLWVNLDKL